jgi:hypothetical protein
MSGTAETAIDIRPFQVEIPEEELAELRRRIAAARWPSRELVTDRSQGVQLATLHAPPGRAAPHPLVAPRRASTGSTRAASSTRRASRFPSR